jgi:hypothetical protein
MLGMPLMATTRGIVTINLKATFGRQLSKNTSTEG